jgi:polyisoprenoid-binding protein YceI
MRAAAAGLSAASLLALLLAACHTPPARQGLPGAKAPATAAQPAEVTEPVAALLAQYAVDAAQSDLRLFVKREGPMAALGHNHVIAVRELHGVVYLADDPRQSQFELSFPVAAMSIDEPAQRAEAGADYQSVVNDAARTGTRNNMLGDKLLQAVNFADISVSSGAITVATPDQLLMELKLRVRDHASTVQVPVRWQRHDDTLRVDSTFTLQQTALGLLPFSIAMGALRVADAIDVRCRIVARRVRA